MQTQPSHPRIPRTTESRPRTRGTPALAALAAVAIAALSLALLGSGTRTARAQEALTASEVFSQVSPAIALVRTPISEGSGILIDQRRVVTAAHVVRPFETVRVSFFGGPDIQDARVVEWDHLADVAVIEIPPQTNRTPVTVASARSLSVGSQIYALGYEGGAVAGDTPTIKGSLLSRFHEWPALPGTWMETDSPVAGGLSGGAMVSAAGEVVGILQFSDNTASFALSASDWHSRVTRLLSGEDIDGLGSRSLVGGRETRSSWTVTLESYYELGVFVVDPPAGQTVTASVNGTMDAAIFASTVDGIPLAGADQTETGTERITFEADGIAPIVVWVVHQGGEPADYTLTFSYPAALYLDADDGRELSPGRPLTGVIDTSADLDFYFLDLVQGQTITVTVESVSIDAIVFVDLTTSPGEFADFDDDSGGGLLLLDPELTYTAEEDGRYVIWTGDSLGFSQGGYIIELSSSGAAGSGVITSGGIPNQGFGLFVFSGGTTDQLIAAAACASQEARFFVLVGGQWLTLIPVAPAAVNAQWNQNFAQGIPENTPMLGLCRS